ncbi:MAG: hypothetical protein ACOX87_04220 [Chloroflexota bacterium]|jgi:hypothetical protein
MKRLALCVLLVALFPSMIINVVQAQPRFEFKLGFKALADEAGDVVGEPLENEHWGDNGDSLQQTTTGLMVWRKADNWTAFTNGAMTWVNGPFGLQTRPNEMRFGWELGLTPPTISLLLRHLNRRRNRCRFRLRIIV